jgi:hypothetical protein
LDLDILIESTFGIVPISKLVDLSLDLIRPSDAGMGVKGEILAWLGRLGRISGSQMVSP